MADQIAVMNEGLIEQVASPREIYARPKTMFVADFIGSPPMNLLPFRAAIRRGESSVRINGADVAVPEIRENVAETDMMLGVRPEHIRLDDASPLRGAVFGAEYLGTTQVVTINAEHGQIKARLPAADRVTTGETVGLAFAADRLSLFDAASGRAVETALFEQGTAGAAHG